jgi:hypothetical protein
MRIDLVENGPPAEHPMSPEAGAALACCGLVTAVPGRGPGAGRLVARHLAL